MSNCYVLRNEFILSREQFNQINEYLKGEISHFKRIHFKKRFNYLIFSVLIDVNLHSGLKEVDFVFDLCEEDEKGNRKALIFAYDKITDIEELFKLFIIDVNRPSTYETILINPLEYNIKIYFQFDFEYRIKDREFYENKKTNYSNLKENEKHNVLMYVDINNQAELFQGLYAFIEKEPYYNNLFHKPIRTEEETMILKELKIIAQRLEHFGYEANFYEKFKTFFDNKINDFFVANKPLDHQTIFAYFICCTFGLINKGLSKGLFDSMKNSLYLEFYKQLEEEGFFNK